MFSQAYGWVQSLQSPPANVSAVFFISGDTSNVAFLGLTLRAPATAGGDAFIPMAFSMSANWKSSQTVNAGTPISSQTAAVPHDLTFSGIRLDGTLMGWQGTVQQTVFYNVESVRYGDLQDANGGNVGGIGKWFPPPHLIYLNYAYTGDPGLFTSNVQISDVLDLGLRVGRARDTGGSDTESGYAASLKLGCTACTVDTYTSYRPDGFMDVLPSESLTVTNAYAQFDSAFINNLYPAGLRFPLSGYSYLMFSNVHLKDMAANTLAAPIGSAMSTGNYGLLFSDVLISMNRWAGSDLPIPAIAGPVNNITLNFAMSGQSMNVSYVQQEAVSVTLKNTPTSLHPGGSTLLDWSSKGAVECTGSGAWNGSVGTSGSRAVKLSTTGTYDFNVRCGTAAQSATAGLQVAAR